MSLNTGADLDYYSFQTASAGVVEVAAAGTWIQVLNTRGGVLAQGNSVVNVSAARNATLIVRVQSANGSPLASYSMSITPKPPASRQTGAVRIGGRPLHMPAPRVSARPAPRTAARPAARVGARPAIRIMTLPAIRLARQEVSPTGRGGFLTTPNDWKGSLRASSSD